MQKGLTSLIEIDFGLTILLQVSPLNQEAGNR